ncbi:cofilin/tropomyosin-type actin-binding protein [Ditylenchus destructor]|nr:cofilin/tropomyosin-type actin-binding protein [Ditylenchus destructor]
MSGSLAVCKITDILKDVLKKFRFQKSPTTNAIILKVNRDQMELCVEEVMEDCTVEDIRNSLPAQHPPGCSIETKMLYAGSRNNLVSECHLTKSAEIRDVDEITEEYLNDRFA